MATNDDVPALEDMSEKMGRIVYLDGSTVRPRRDRGAKDGVPTFNAQSEKDGTDKKSTTSSVDTQSTPNASSKPSTTAEKPSSQSFGGFKKGFLFGGSKAGSGGGAKKGEEIIKPKVKEPYRFEEVQEAMRASESFLDKKKGDEWVTPDLMSRIQSNPELCQQLLNPRTLRALTELQADPTNAWERYKDDPTTLAFLKDFSSILGDHFTQLGDKQQSPAAAGGNQSAPATSPGAAFASEQLREVSSTSLKKKKEVEEDEEASGLLAQPGMRTLLQDWQVKRLFHAMRTDEDKAQQILRTADADLQAKIRRLVEAGLLQFER